MAMRKNRKRNIAELALWIAAIILINLFFSTRYFRIDLTDEKRYTLAPITKQFLRGFEKDVMVKVYLDGDLNAGFRRLSRATRETLEEFRIVSRGKLYYEFVDPKEEPGALEELKNLDLSPVSLFETTSDGRRIQSNIYPYANFHIEGYELTVNLLENLPGLSGEANLNLSVEALEYKITDVMRRLLTEDTPAIAFLEGHGELDEMDVYDVTEALSHYYQVDRGSLTSDPYILDVYKALIIAKPRFKFSERDKFVLDQYVMRGGKVLWLIDAVQVTLDSLRTATQTVGMPTDLGLSDLLFRYGIRINQELVQDVQAAMIPVNVAGPGEQPKFVPVPWMFNPLLSTNSSHPVTRSVNLVKGEFVSSIDTVGVFPGMKRDILLQTSQNARRLPIPVFISLAMVNEQPNSRDFVNAFVPVANALVMVHSNKADSAFRTQVPLRVTRSNSTGRFSIQNLAPGEYRLFALEDANRNYKYDQPGERIAWHSELVSPHIGFHERVDSVGVDSTVVVQVQAFLPDSLQLFMFQEDNIAQYLADFRRPLRNKVDLVFSRPLLEPLEVEIVNKENFDKSAIYESSARHDSVSLWLKDSLHIKSDSLFLHLKYPVLDSLKQLTWKNDTINAYFFDTNIEAREGRGRRREEEALPEAPSLKIEGLKANVEILEAVAIQFASPIENINRDRLRLFQIIDTIPKAIDFDVVQDSLRLRRYSIEFSRVAAGKYSLEIDSAAFTDIYGLSNNALKQNISIRAEDEYATFYIEIVEPDSNWLLEVLDRQEKVVRSLKVPRNGKMGFRYIRPGDYIIRIVDDKNNNGEWDTGNFELGLQPENIYYYPETVSVRANWDHIINWEPKLFDIYDFVQRMRSKQSSSAARRP
jgi:ABC-2 type transport system permease protein